MTGLNRVLGVASIIVLLVTALLVSVKCWQPTANGNPVPIKAAATPLPASIPVKTPAPAVQSATPGAKAMAAAAPRFVQLPSGEFSTHTKIYDATLSTRGELSYRATGGDKAEGAATELRIALGSITRGTHTVFDSASPENALSRTIQSNPADATGKVALPRGRGATEYYAPRGDGIEQFIDFANLPEGSGDLRFSFDLKLNGLSPRLDRRPYSSGGGIQFFDANGSFKVRYGQVFVRDSALHGISVEPHLAAGGKKVEFSVPAAWLDTAAFPISIDPLVGGDLQISPDNGTGVGAPSVCAGNNGYLVVWTDYTLGAKTPVLLASLMTQSGIASQPFALSSQGTAPREYRFQRTEVAFDGTNWLVVWTEDDASGSQIHGALVSSGTASTTAGTLIGGTEFAIAGTTSTIEEDPLVTFNGLDFVVAWTSGVTGATGTASATASQIYYARVTSGGIVSGVQIVPAQTSTPNQALLFLAPQKPAGDTLLIYRENAENPPATRGTRISADGTVRDVGGITLFQESKTSNGFGRPIGASFYNSAWQILSSFDQTTDSAVYLHQLSLSAFVTPPTGVFTTVGLGATGNTTLDQYAPAFAGIAGISTNGNASGNWLFLRNEKVNNNTRHILGKRVGFDGTDLDPIPFQVDTSTQGILRNAVAAQAGGLFLSVWLDGRRAPTQPGDSYNIFGALIDTTVPDNTGVPLLPVISASPTTGVPSLLVSFDSSASTGTFDTLSWIFGDGSTSTQPVVSHTYTQNGTYIAQLKLTRGSYSVIRTVLITVGTGGGNSGGGGSQVGTPLTNSDDLVSSLFIRAGALSLDFTQTNNDSAEVAGTIDISTLPASLTGLTGSVSIGSISHTFSLDAKGNYSSDAAQKPRIVFGVNAKKGTFDWLTVQDSLQAEMDLLGAKNVTTSTPVFVDVPVTIQIGTFTATSTIGMRYRATVNKTGTGTYNFLKTGKIVSGTFLVTKFSAAEQTSKSGPVHTFNIQGQIVRPDGATFKISPSGQFVFAIGNYALSFPASQFVNTKGSLKFTSRKGASGLKKFTMDATSGKFSLEMNQVPATGAGGTGLWLSSGNNIVDVALNLSFKFDLSDQQLTAGRYVFIARKKATAKAWTLQ